MGAPCYAVALRTGFAAVSKFTDTIFDTPGSCIVTPYITGAMLIVFLLCVMMMNCVPPDISFTSSVNRSRSPSRMRARSAAFSPT